VNTVLDTVAAPDICCRQHLLITCCTRPVPDAHATKPLLHMRLELEAEFGIEQGSFSVQSHNFIFVSGDEKTASNGAVDNGTD